MSVWENDIKRSKFSYTRQETRQTLQPCETFHNSNQWPRQGFSKWSSQVTAGALRRKYTWKAPPQPVGKKELERTSCHQLGETSQLHKLPDAPEEAERPFSGSKSLVEANVTQRDGSHSATVLGKEYARQRPNKLVRLQNEGLPGLERQRTSRKFTQATLQTKLVRSGKHSLVRRASLVSAARALAAAGRSASLHAAANLQPTVKQTGLFAQGNLQASAAQVTGPRKLSHGRSSLPHKSGNLYGAPPNNMRYSLYTRHATEKLKGLSRVFQARKANSKPAKLVRMGGVLYKVSGSGRSRSLKRQITPFKAVSKSVQVHKYQQNGNTLLRVDGSAAGSPATNLKAKVSAHQRSTVTPAKRKRHLAPLSSSPKKRAKLGFVAQIKQRSRFINQPCLRYCRTGVCADKDKGNCSLQHDPVHVAVCPKWLTNRCSNPDCKLQHTFCPNLMPLCVHFLKGQCSNASCPYLHVKLDAKAPACRAFLQGFCSKGAACPHQHLTAGMLRELRAKKRTGKPAEQAEDGRGCQRRNLEISSGSGVSALQKSERDDDSKRQGKRKRDSLLPAFLRSL